MTKYYVLLPLLLTLTSGSALAAAIPDYSLSPEETARQPSSNSHNTYQQYPNQTNLNGAPTPMLSTNNPLVASAHFMDGYCDRNFTPAIADNPQYANLAGCLRQHKEQTCSQFQALPDDVKRVLDQTIECTNNVLGGDNIYEAHAPSSANCAEMDTQRLQLLKKYWRDQNTAYALVFLPDDVLENAGKCLHGGQP